MVTVTIRPFLYSLNCIIYSVEKNLINNNSHYTMHALKGENLRKEL